MTDFQWIAIALGDVAWISIAFVLGLLSRSVGLPPLVGFLATGFMLNAMGIVSGEMLDKLSDLGITLLLFTIGLKLNLRMLAMPQIWAVTSIHTVVTTSIFGLSIYALSLVGIPLLLGMDLTQALLIGFALSFSSTVFAAKALEERGEMASLHGRTAIGILIMQDIAAVAFLAFSMGQWPSIWVLLVVLLIPLRPILYHLLHRVGHGELLVLYGLLLALGGAEIFELVGLKGDLGALVLGVLIAGHPKVDEMAKTMLGFKDLFLLGFFLSIGLSGQPSLETLGIASVIVVFVLVKSLLFFGLLTGFRFRARTSLLASLNLSNYSEFGLIVAAVSVANGWIGAKWLVIIAIAIALSFAIAAGLNAVSHQIYTRHRSMWKRLQRKHLAFHDQHLNAKGATIAIIGMGRVGTGAYDAMSELHGETVVGIDIDPITAERRRNAGRNVLHGDPSDADFWDRIQAAHKLDLVMLALPKLSTSLAVLKQLNSVGYTGKIAAAAKYSDQTDLLLKAGADTVFNIYTEAGSGFAAHVVAQGFE